MIPAVTLRLRQVCVLLALCGGAALATAPLFVWSTYPSGHDTALHINSAYQAALSMHEGVLLPQWMATSNGGYGSPTLIFYSPLFHWLVAALSLPLGSLVTSLKVVTVGGFLVSGITMYLFLRRFAGRWGGVVGGVAYQLLPFHVVGVFWRGSLAEALGFAWVPLVLHFAFAVGRRVDLRALMGLALSYAGLVLTHLVSAYLIGFVVLFHGLWVAGARKDFMALPRQLVGMAFGLCLSAVYFLPMFFERRFVNVEAILSAPWGNYRNNFLFGTLHPPDQFTGFLWLLGGLDLLALLLLAGTRLSGVRFTGTSRYVVRFFCLLLPAAFLMMTPLSRVAWELVPGLATIQFPWRWLLVSGLASASLLGLWVGSAPLIRAPLVRAAGWFAWAALLTVSALLSWRYLVRADALREAELQRILEVGGDYAEHRPLWTTDRGALLPIHESAKVGFSRGGGRLEVQQWRTHERRFIANLDGPAQVRARTFFYPGWVAFADGERLPMRVESGTGAILIDLPAGRSVVQLAFQDTPLRSAARWISALSLAVAVMGLVAPASRWAS